MCFKYHIDRFTTCRYGVIGQNLTPDSRGARGHLCVPPSRAPGREGGKVPQNQKQNRFAAWIAVTDDVDWEARYIRYSKFVIFQSFLLRFGRGFRRFIRLKLLYNVVLSSRKERHCRLIVEELSTSYFPSFDVDLWQNSSIKEFQSSSLIVIKSLMVESKIIFGRINYIGRIWCYLSRPLPFNRSRTISIR